MAIIRVKVSAVYLNPDGMGIVSQITMLQEFLSRIVDLGVGGGVTKYIAEYEGTKEYEKLKGVYKTAISGFAITGLLVIVTCTVLSEKISLLILGDEQYSIYIIIASIAISLKTQYSVIERTLQGLLKIKETVILSVFSSFTGVLVTVPLIIFYDVTGAVVSFALVGGITLIAGHIYLDNIVAKIGGLTLNFGKIERKHLFNLLKFGGANSTVFLSNMLSLLAVRSIIVNEMGAESNGLYEVAIGISASFIGIVSTSIWQYAMPKVATMLGESDKIQKLQNDALKLILFVLVPITVMLLISRELWIPLLYSSEFLPAYSLIGWQLLGEYFRAIKWAPNIVNQPYERYSFIMAQAVAHGLLHIGIFLLLYQSWGLFAAPFSYAVTQGIMIPVVLGVHYYYDKFVFDLKNWVILLTSSFLLGLTLYLFNDRYSQNIEGFATIVLLLIGWFLFSTTKDERDKAKKLIKRKLKM